MGLLSAVSSFAVLEVRDGLSPRSLIHLQVADGMQTRRLPGMDGQTTALLLRIRPLTKPWTSSECTWLGVLRGMPVATQPEANKRILRLAYSMWAPI
jgi:hypothetical protein